MFLLMNFEYELLIMMKLKLRLFKTQIFVKLLHNERLSAPRVSPYVHTLNIIKIFELISNKINILRFCIMILHISFFWHQQLFWIRHHLKVLFIFFELDLMLIQLVSVIIKPFNHIFLIPINLQWIWWNLILF